MANSITADQKKKAVAIETLAKHRIDGKNWVGALQDAAVTHGVAMPVYAITKSDDYTAKQPRFKSVCECSGRSALGYGLTKKEAKQESAQSWCGAC